MPERAPGQVSPGPAYNVAAGHSHLGPPPGEWVWRVKKALQERPWAPEEEEEEEEEDQEEEEEQEQEEEVLLTAYIYIYIEREREFGKFIGHQACAAD